MLRKPSMMLKEFLVWLEVHYGIDFEHEALRHKQTFFRCQSGDAAAVQALTQERKSKYNTSTVSNAGAELRSGLRSLQQERQQCYSREVDVHRVRSLYVHGTGASAEV